MRNPQDPAAGSFGDADIVFAHPAFNALKAQGACFVIAAGDPAHVTWANRNAALVFDARSAADLTAKLLHGAGAAARRLTFLASEGPTGGAPRLERLRFVRGLTTMLATALCIRVPRDDASPLFGLALMASPQTAGWHDPAATWRTAADWVMMEENTPATPSAQSVEPDPAQLPTAAALRERAIAAAGGHDALRFCWRTDAAHRLSHFDTPVFASIAAPSPAIGASFDAEIGRLDEAGGAHLREALNRLASWSGVLLDWPVLDGSGRAPVTLGGAPVFEHGRRFAGFRGFGQVNLDRLAAASAAPGLDLKGGTEPISHAVTQAPEEAAKEGDAPPDRVLAPVLGLTLADRSPTDAEAPAERQAGDHAAEAAPEPVALTPAAEAAPESIALTPAAEAAGMAAGAAVAANVVRFRPLQAIGLSRHAAGAEAGADRRSLAAGSDRETPADGVEATTGALLGTESSDTMALGGSLSPSELSAFAEIARTLAAPQAEAPGAAARRPIREVRSVASLPVPAQDPDEATAQEDSAPVAEASPEARVAPVPEGAADREGALVARHAAAVLDLLPEPLMISRGSALLFANRGLLALLGYADVAEWRAADQVLPRAAPETAMTGDAPIDIALRHRDGSAVPVTARRRPLLPEDPEGPTVLWTLAQPLPPSQISPSQISPAPDPSAAWAGDHKPMPGLLDLAGEAFVILDEGGRIEALNRRALDWFAGQRKPPLGLNFTSLLASESRATAVAMLADAQAAAGRADHEPVAREVQARTADGRIMPMRLTMACPAPGRVHVALHDLSDLKRAEQEVVRAKREAERASGRQPEFLAKVSHEIRTPLNAILGFAEVMMDERFGPLGNARYKDYLKDIHDSGTQVMSLVNDLLDLSQIEAGRLEIALDAIDVNKVILDCVAAMQPQAHRERVIMRTSLGARLPRILADDRTVRQIVTNLLSNAVKFNEPGGQVIVSTAINDGHGIAVRIRDTGIGMSDSDIAAALEPFRQLASSKTVSGTGLGLPLTKALIGANGATLSIRSRPKEGTFVEVVFAAAVEAVVAAPARVTG